MPAFIENSIPRYDRDTLSWSTIIERFDRFLKTQQLLKEEKSDKKSERERVCKMLDSEKERDRRFSDAP